MKDKQTISSLGAILSDSRKFGKKASSKLNKSKMKVSELESSLILKEADYTLKLQSIVTSKDKEREISSGFVHLFSLS